MISIATEGLAQKPKKWAPLALGFRPFFILAAWIGLVFMLVSAGGFVTGIWHYNYFDLPLWHAHEMLFGFTIAGIAGFLLTAVRNWTGIATPSGRVLGVLVLLWLAPRFLSAVPIPPLLFALLDLSFLPILAFIIFRRVMQAGQAHNYSVPSLLMLLAFANLGIHLDVLAVYENISGPMLHLAVLGLVAMVALISGRVIPFFIGGVSGDRPQSNQLVERMAIASILIFALVNLFLPPSLAAGVAMMVALLHGVRLFGWYSKTIWLQPLLWVLWFGYAWLIAGFVLYAVSLFIGLSLIEAVHAWTIGGIGLVALGMMARVSLGHTGRKIEALFGMPLAFVLLICSALSRVGLPLINGEWLELSILLAAGCWVLAFLIFAVRYTGLLLKARIDGKEG